VPELQGLQDGVPGAGGHGAYKSEFLAQQYKGKLHPLHHYVLDLPTRLARLGSLTPALTNALLTGAVTSPLIKYMVGVAQERTLPRLARRAIKKLRGTNSETSNVPRSAKGSPSPPRSCLWPDTWNNYYHPQTLAAAESCLTEAGFAVQVPRGTSAAGGRSTTSDFLTAARAYLAKVLDRMAGQIDAGTALIFLEPSCASVFKDELLELFPNDARAKRLSGKQVWLLADWLAPPKRLGWAKGRLEGAHILVHGHCHHKAVFGGSAQRDRSAAPGREPPWNRSRRDAAAWPGRLALRRTNSRCRRRLPRTG
jgi:Fe-S oxidoreductase